MKKIFAEIIAGVIPGKISRNRCRGLLRYGILNVIRLKYRLKRDHTSPKYYLAICAIAKNEGTYFQEWIEWHRKMGVEKFYIYDNESTDCTKNVLKPYIESGLVEYHYWPGSKQQLPAYDHCFETHRTEARWIAVIDLDEFIVPIKDRTIPDFLRRMEKFSVVEINWLVYGSGGAKKREPGGVMERFKCHALPDNRLNMRVKSIANPRCVCTMIGCHEAARISGCVADSYGEPVKTYFGNRKPQLDVIHINHYAVKSYEEFLTKQARGRARINKLRDLSYFENYDLNDIED